MKFEKLKEINKLSDIIHQGNEFTILKFSNLLQKLGYEDICNNGNIEEILESESIVVKSLIEGEIIIYFMLIEKNENILNNIVSIIEVDEF